jgi:CubicO group peptidase (beta-lactamase class C family)
MNLILKRGSIRIGLNLCVVLALLWTDRLYGQERSVDSKLEGFDEYMTKVFNDWNVPGIGVGIVVNDKLVFAKGYGYRDYEKKLPFTSKTLCPIASNTKLFTSVAAGMLVKEGKLDWDKPIRDAVPSIRFFNNELNNTITLRDMLSHRTGVTRHDSIWYKSDFTRRELFERLQFMEPKEPPRQVFLYNNLMYAAAGYIIELKSGKPWEDFVRERILHPLEMASTVYSIADMTNAPDFGVPFTEKRDSRELYRTPYYENTAGVGPCGAIISSVEDMSHWLRALMNEGRYNEQQVLPPEVLAATLEPAIALPNVAGETRGYWETLNDAYGMGRDTASYRGHLLTFHGGALGGFYSQVSFMPQDHIGVIVLVIGEHCATLSDTVGYSIYERLLGLSLTPWSERALEIYQKGKKAGTEARAKAGSQQVTNTKPSHALETYVGEYEHPAYGVLKITQKGDDLQFDFHRIHLPLSHFHYDRFDTPDDELDGKWSVNFATNPQGDVDKATMSLDEAEATFVRKPETLEPKVLQALAGTYETPTGSKFHIVFKEDGKLYRVRPGQPEQKFLPYRGLKFHIQEFSDLTLEFLMENGRPSGLKMVAPSGEYLNKRVE